MPGRLSKNSASVFWAVPTWDPVKEQFGALPAIFGTLVTSLIGLIIAVPISLGAAVFLVELAPSWMRSSASFLIEMLAAIPSVIIGLWGIFVLVPIVRSPIETWLGDKLGFFALISGTAIRIRFSGRRNYPGHYDHSYYYGR